MPFPLLPPKPPGPSPKSTPLNPELARLRAETRRVNAATAILQAAHVAGWANPEDAVRMVNLDALDVDTDGTVPGAADAVAEMARRYPHLAAGQAPRGGGTPTREEPRRSPVQPGRPLASGEPTADPSVLLGDLGRYRT